MTEFGLCVGDHIELAAAWEARSGLRAAYLSAHGGKAHWEDWRNGLEYELWQCGMSRRPLVCTLPMFPNGVTFEECSAGSHDDQYTYQATRILDKFTGDEVVHPRDEIYLRFGEEFNGGWFQWASYGKEAQYIALFRRMVGLFRAVSPRFQIVWCPVAGQNNPEGSYPGDDVVDLIGLDLYHFPEWDEADPAKAFAFQKSRWIGLDWLTQFATFHKKPICIPEWAVKTDTMTQYMGQMVQWCLDNKVVYANYWNNDGDYPGDLTHYPAVDAAYTAALKGLIAAPAPTPVPPPAPEPAPVPTPPAPAPVPTTEAPYDYLIVRVSGDSYNGDPEFYVYVDGQPATGPYTTKASHASGQTDDIKILGPFAAGPHAVKVMFGEDAWGGSDAQDRNLYVHGVAFWRNPVIPTGEPVALLRSWADTTFQTA